MQRNTYNDKNEIIHVTRFFKKLKESDILKAQLIDKEEQCISEVEKYETTIAQQKKELMALKKELKIYKK